MQEIRVILVDGNDHIRDGMKALLEETGDIQVIGQTGSERHANQLIQNHNPDVLILELKSDLADALQKLEQIRSEHADLKVLLSGSYLSLTIVQAALDAGAAGYLLKEDAPEQLIDAVRSVAAGKTGWLSSHVR